MKKKIEELQNKYLTEKQQWLEDKAKFESDPMHWTNNRRKQSGLPVLRGTINKNRPVAFPEFKTSVTFRLQLALLEQKMKKNLSSWIENIIGGDFT